MMSNNDNMASDPHVFYGLSLPVDVIHTIDIKLVFDDKKDVLEAIKSHKGSRFKAFNNVDDAIEFSKHAIKPETSSCDPNKDNKNIEKSLSPFSGLHPRELTKLRKAIESDDYETVDQLIWSNPRFLVSSGDTPAILHEAFRYNACHIAAKTNRYRVLELILNTVSDNKFMKLLFPFDTNEVTQSRINFLLDLYLNTPEKGFCETPLHFGCKFGSIEVVSVLLRHAKCDSEKVNKFGRKPIEMICERKGDESAKHKIMQLFESQIFVPLFRNDFSAQVGTPVKGLVGDYNVSALAGPMSPKQADELFQSLKSPRRCTPIERRIRLTDSRKGLERVARNLCKDMNIIWAEFWPFLNTRIDLTSDEGLNLLEKHLCHIYYVLDSHWSRQLIHCTDFDNSLVALSVDLSKLSLNSNVSSVPLKEPKNEIFTNDLKCIINDVSLPDCLSDQSNYDSDSAESDDSFVSALSSPSYLFDFYVYGSKISNDDIDAALALQHVIECDRCLKYDFIQNWFHRVVRENPKQFECDFTTNSPLSSTPIKSYKK